MDQSVLSNENVENNSNAANNKPVYSMPGILHFIQHEWSRFEIERAQWDVERAELQARIAFLQGERKGQENLKRDLIRRVKMLEFALKQERAKVQKLKAGRELDNEMKSIETDDEIINDVSNTNTNLSWRQGRQLLRQYLQEVGYSDTILDVRSQRIRSLLGREYDATNDNDKTRNKKTLLNQKLSGPHQKITAVEDALKEFNFLTSLDNEAEMTEIDGGDEFVPTKLDSTLPGTFDDDDYNDTEMALAEFAFHNPNTGDTKLTDWSVDENKINVMKEQFRLEKLQARKKVTKRPDKKHLQNMLESLRGSEGPEETWNENVNFPMEQEGIQPPSGNEALELGLGDLAGLTVTNEADPLALELSTPDERYRKSWNSKFTLRSHFDGIRSVKFLPKEAALITGSEDHTLKLWNLKKPLPGKRAQSLDVEPVYCFRGHTRPDEYYRAPSDLSVEAAYPAFEYCGGNFYVSTRGSLLPCWWSPVLCVEVGSGGLLCFSGGVDASVRCWAVPSVDVDPYDTYNTSLTSQLLIGHTDAVWSLSYSESRALLLSASADSTINLWKPESCEKHVQSLLSKGSTPTSVEFVRHDNNRAVASYSNGKILLFDLETGKELTCLSGDSGTRVNAVASLPTIPLTASANDEGKIEFYDHVSGKRTHSMVAHLDAVTCLTVDPSGTYILSGSHDSSIRLWNLDSKTCLQEITAHRRKNDESIFSVAIHSNGSYIASAGADALAKVYM